MLKRLTGFLLMLFSVSAFAQQAESTFTVISQSENILVISVKPSAAIFSELGNGYKVYLDKGSDILDKGFPDIQKLTTSVICPSGKKWKIETVTVAGYSDYNKVIVPSKGNVSRLINIDSLPYSFNKIYNNNLFYPSQLAELREPYILRDYTGQAIVFHPVVYNPATQTVRRYNEMIVVLKSVSDRKLFTKNSLNQEYESVYKSHFLNYYNLSEERKYTPLGEEGDLLIICCDSFINAMEPFIKWKKEKGINTEIVSLSSIGDSARLIKSFIRSYYDTHNLSFVLLVGDAEQLTPSKTKNGTSDNEYGYLLGDDSYPEVIVGRFSAQKILEVATQVSKVIQYEKYPSANTEGYKTGIAIGSNNGEGIGINGLADWEFERGIRTQLLNYNYTSVHELYDADHGGIDAPGNPSSSDLVNAINTGASIINYTGHGTHNSILTTGFSNNNVVTLTNNLMLPFMCVVGCQAGNFVNQTCLGEALARATNGNNPTGAIASVMATIDQAWVPPMEGQAAFNRILTENEPDNIKHSFGGIVANACMEMNDMFGNDGAAISDTWITFGDPSVIVRTDAPGLISANHPATVPTGTTSLLISCNNDGANACLTLHGEIISRALVTGGIASFSFETINTPDTIHICITGYNKTPYINDIPVLPVNEPYIIPVSYSIADSDGNNNGKADYDEEAGFIFSIKNIGVFTADSVTGILTSKDPYITISDSTKYFGDISAGDIITNITAYKFLVSDSVPDQHISLFNISFSDNNGHLWNTPITITLNAPALNAISHFIIDRAGNNNSILDPGEADSIAVVTKNQGHSISLTGKAFLGSSEGQVAVGQNTANAASLLPGESDTLLFPLNVFAGIRSYATVDFSFQRVAGRYNISKTLEEKIGKAEEGFESNSLNNYNWKSEGTPWFTTNINPFSGSYCAQSGSIGNKASSVLSIEVNSLFDDSISFARRVSSEQSYDFLAFYVDSFQASRWSGELAWEKFSLPVAAGQHAFKWIYTKDVSGTGGDDAAWLDDIELPFSALTTITSTENSLTLAPNPASAAVRLQYLLNASATISIDVFGMQGQRVMNILNNQKTNASLQTIQINTSLLSSGTYLVRFIVDSNTYTRKLVISK